MRSIFLPAAAKRCWPEIDSVASLSAVSHAAHLLDLISGLKKPFPVRQKKLSASARLKNFAAAFRPAGKTEVFRRYIAIGSSDIVSYFRLKHVFVAYHKVKSKK